MSETDWLGAALTFFIIFFMIVIIIAKIQGQRVIDVLAQFRDLIRGQV
jgi:hypothetical protein